MKPEVVICTYQVKKNCEVEFESLLQRHEPTLRKAELVTDEAFQVFKSINKEGEATYTEIFTWVDKKASGEAHDLPEISAIWEPMGRLVEDRKGQPKWNFIHCDKVDLNP